MKKKTKNRLPLRIKSLYHLDYGKLRSQEMKVKEAFLELHDQFRASNAVFDERLPGVKYSLYKLLTETIKLNGMMKSISPKEMMKLGQVELR